MLQALNLPKKVYFKPGCMPVALQELGDIYLIYMQKGKKI